MSDTNNLEIERKILVFNDGWKKDVEESFVIKQGYLSINPVLRVRVVDDMVGYMTIKIPHSEYAVKEFEYEIPVQDAQKLLLECKNIINKTRNIVYHDTLKYEVDEFHGLLSGMVMAEVELPDINAINGFPIWADLDVTGDKNFSNVSLTNRDSIIFLEEYKKKDISNKVNKVSAFKKF